MNMTLPPIKPGYLRVTEVLSPFSGLSKIDPMVLQNAADRGALVHQIIEGIEQGFGKENVPEHVEGYIQSYETWADGKDFLPAQKRLCDSNLMITGLVDAIYREGNDLVLVDYKTPARESKTWELQGSAYSHLCKIIGYNIARIEFVKLDKRGKYPEIFRYQENMAMFRKALDCYRYFFEDKSKEELELDYL
jgi:hypothetical protein